jgi:hypothetical protein
MAVIHKTLIPAVMFAISALIIIAVTMHWIGQREPMAQIQATVSDRR